MIESKLDDFAVKNAQKGGSTAHYITAAQALRDDLLEYLRPILAEISKEIKNSKEELVRCKQELQESKKREEELKVQNLCKWIGLHTTDKSTEKHEILMAGSSILREVRDEDIVNGTVKCVRGGQTEDIKSVIKNVDFSPHTIITHIGGNDLSNKEKTVETICDQYAEMITEAKMKFPESDLVVSGLTPRFNSEEIREKVTRFNKITQKWCKDNSLTFVDNECAFELKNGEWTAQRTS